MPSAFERWKESRHGLGVSLVLLPVAPSVFLGRGVADEGKREASYEAHYTDPGSDSQFALHAAGVCNDADADAVLTTRDRPYAYKIGQETENEQRQGDDEKHTPRPREAGFVAENSDEYEAAGDNRRKPGVKRAPVAQPLDNELTIHVSDFGGILR